MIRTVARYPAYGDRAGAGCITSSRLTSSIGDDGVMPELCPGALLVANPLLPDENFHRSVVLLLSYGPEGALGVVLNRPSETGMDEVLDRWETFSSAPPVLFVGGPVNQDAVICLARLTNGVPARVLEENDSWSCVEGDLGTLDLDLDPKTLGGSVSGLRVFAGYAGWGAGQLEAELASEAWWVIDSLPADPFDPDPDRLWTKVLRRQRGPLQIVSSYPDDPLAN